MTQNRRRFLAIVALSGAAFQTLAQPAASQSLEQPVLSTWRANRLSFPEIVYSRKTAQPIRFAGEQLDHYLRLILDAESAEAAPGRGPRILLEEVHRTDLGDEGYELLCEGRDLFIRGTPSAIVYGVFDFLRNHARCRFSGLGPYAEDIPKRENLDLKPFQSVRKPRLWYRGYQYYWREPLELVIQRLDWMTKNGLNYVMYNFIPDDITDPMKGSIAPSGALADRARFHTTERWFRDHVQPEVLRRGLKLDFNHHNFHFWIPAERYYAEHPEWFALIDGKRTPTTDHRQFSICTSNEEAVGTLIKNVLLFLRDNPAVRIVGVIQEDGRAACQCDRCLRMDADPKQAFQVSDSDDVSTKENTSKAIRYARLINQVARAVAKEFPDRLVGHSAYGDVRYPPRGVTLEPNVVTWVAVGGRDAFHPISPTSASAANRALFENLRQWKRVHPGKVILYEYYMASNAAKSIPYPIADLICQDWTHLKQLGIEGATVQCWSSNHDAYGMNNLAFARSGWEDNVDPEEVFQDFVVGYFGKAAGQVTPLFRGLIAARQDAANKPSSIFLSKPPAVASLRDTMTVGYYLEKVGGDTLRQAAAPVLGGREEVQIRRLGAVIEYWRRAADVSRLGILAKQAEEQGRKSESLALYKQAVAAVDLLVAYVEVLPAPGWMAALTGITWRRQAVAWESAMERLGGSRRR